MAVRAALRICCRYGLPEVLARLVTPSVPSRPPCGCIPRRGVFLKQENLRVVEEGYNLLTSIEPCSSDFVCGTEFLLPAKEVFHRGEDALAPRARVFCTVWAIPKPRETLSHGIGRVASQIVRKLKYMTIVQCDNSYYM